MLGSTHHLVIDLETFATSPRAMVRSIGLARFDPWSDAPPKATRYVLSPTEQEGREVDAEIMLWWMRQPEGARSSFVGDGRTCRMQTLICHSDLFAARDMGCDVGWPVVWCKPLHFDVPILLDLLRSKWPSIDREDGPLYRRRVHNARTIYEAASLLGERVDEDPAREGINPDDLHDPSVDARLTALTVRRALRILRDASTSTGTRRPPRELFVDDDERLVDRV